MFWAFIKLDHEMFGKLRQQMKNLPFPAINNLSDENLNPCQATFGTLLYTPPK